MTLLLCRYGINSLRKCFKAINLFDSSHLKLSGNITFSDQVNFARYNDVDMTSPAAVTMGWGATIVGLTTPSHILYVDVIITYNHD